MTKYPKVETLLNELTLEEKLMLLSGTDNWHTAKIDRLNIPELTLSDGPHGVRKEKTENGQYAAEPALAFPTASIAACTWNTNLIFAEGQALADECSEHGVDVLLGPGINIKRSPLCGRNFEYFSEDPYLSGKMASAYISGVQSHGIGTCLKHFAGNQQETDRQYSNSEIDERTLREIYLKAFEIAVKEGNPWSMMCAYNRLNGVHCSENPWLLKEVLRKEWKYEGVMISDWGAVHNRPKALKAGLDLEMPYAHESFETLKKAYESQKITTEEINTACENLLYLIQRIQTEKDLCKNNIMPKKKREAIAKKVAEESIVLLKNEQNILPLPKKFCKAAVIGKCAEQPFIQGGGSACVTPSVVETPLQEIQKFCHGTASYAPAYNLPWQSTAGRPEPFQFQRALDIAASADVAIVFVGNGEGVERESSDRCSLKLDAHYEELICRVSQVNQQVIVVVQAGAAIDMSEWIQKVSAVVWAGYGGSFGAEALAKVLFGDVCPSGKLAETFPMNFEDTPIAQTYLATAAVRYWEGPLVGYRYYDTFHKKVLFPFGFGLSYTSFKIENSYLSSNTIKEGENTIISCDVTNVGTVAGSETIQVYIRDMTSSYFRPEKELRAFNKVHLKPGQTQQVGFVLSSEDFAVYSTVYHKWCVEPGMFEIMIGTSAENIILRQRLRYEPSHTIDLRADYYDANSKIE